MYRYTEASTGGLLQFFVAEPELQRNFFTDIEEKLLTIAWNRGPAQSVWVDELEHRLERDDLMLLIVSHSYRFAHPECVTAWRLWGSCWKIAKRARPGRSSDRNGSERRTTPPPALRVPAARMFAHDRSRFVYWPGRIMQKHAAKALG